MQKKCQRPVARLENGKSNGRCNGCVIILSGMTACKFEDMYTPGTTRLMILGTRQKRASSPSLMLTLVQLMLASEALLA